MDYQKAKSIFETARDKSAGKPIANNTRLVQRGECYAVRLHATDILTFAPDGSVTYNSGGWRTVTTKARMNEYGPLRIFSDRGTWYANPGRVLYADGMRVTARGNIIGAGKPSDAEREKSLRKAIAKYARDYVSALYAGELERPSTGDCWGCCMVTAKGEAPLGGCDHIRSHIEDGYYVPSLAWRAMERVNAGDAYKRELAILQKFDGAEDHKPMGGFVVEQLTRFIRKHCLRECGLAA